MSAFQYTFVSVICCLVACGKDTSALDDSRNNTISSLDRGFILTYTFKEVSKDSRTIKRKYTLRDHRLTFEENTTGHNKTNPVRTQHQMGDLEIEALLSFLKDHQLFQNYKQQYEENRHGTYALELKLFFQENKFYTITVKGNYYDTSMNLFYKRLDLLMLKLDKMKKAE